MESKIFLIDFDDTCVISNFPDILADNLMAIETLKELVANGHRLILFTCRTDINTSLTELETGLKCGIASGRHLTNAGNWFRKNNIPLFGIQKNPEQTYKHVSPKPWFDYIIDDKALGIPTLKLKITEDKTIEYVDWFGVRKILHSKGLI